MNRTPSLLALASLSLTVACSTTPLPFGLEAPGLEPELFAPGIVSTEDAIELNGVLRPDGREFFFTRLDPDKRMIMHRSRLIDGEWTGPERIEAFPDGAGDWAVDMSYTPDGDSLIFLGRGPGGLGDEPGLDLWTMDRDGDGWSYGTVIPKPVSSDGSEYYPCVVGDGSIYFSSNRPGTLGSSDVWRAQRLEDGTYAEPVNVGAPVNTEHSEGDTWVSPDETLLVVSSRRPGGEGSSDLYVSRRDAEGHWTEPKNLGPTINTDGIEFCPMGTWDGRVLFFSRRVGNSWAETTAGTVHWVSAEVLNAPDPG